MVERVSGFDWNAANRAHCQKHGVSVAEIEALFRNTPRVAPDLRHAHLEDRLVAIGRNGRGRAMFVVFTIRERGGLRLIRPASARYMHAKEVARYEAETAQTDERSGSRSTAGRRSL